MNAMIRKISGTFDVVNFVSDDKLDQLAALLGLSAAEKAALKEAGTVVVVQQESEVPQRR